MIIGRSIVLDDLIELVACVTSVVIVCHGELEFLDGRLKVLVHQCGVCHSERRCCLYRNVAYASLAFAVTACSELEDILTLTRSIPEELYLGSIRSSVTARAASLSHHILACIDRSASYAILHVVDIELDKVISARVLPSDDMIGQLILGFVEIERLLW